MKTTDEVISDLKMLKLTNIHRCHEAILRAKKEINVLLEEMKETGYVAVKCAVALNNMAPAVAELEESLRELVPNVR